MLLDLALAHKRFSAWVPLHYLFPWFPTSHLRFLGLTANLREDRLTAGLVLLGTSTTLIPDVNRGFHCQIFTVRNISPDQNWGAHLCQLGPLTGQPWPLAVCRIVRFVLWWVPQTTLTSFYPISMKAVNIHSASRKSFMNTLETQVEVKQSQVEVTMINIA